MKPLSRYALARRLLKDADRYDLTVRVRAALVIAANLVASEVIRDPKTPWRLVMPLTTDVVRSAEALETPKAVH
jgi:hypothetical protein